MATIFRMRFGASPCSLRHSDSEDVYFARCRQSCAARCSPRVTSTQDHHFWPSRSLSQVAWSSAVCVWMGQVRPGRATRRHQDVEAAARGINDAEVGDRVDGGEEAEEHVRPASSVIQRLLLAVRWVRARLREAVLPSVRACEAVVALAACKN